MINTEGQVIKKNEGEIVNCLISGYSLAIRIVGCESSLPETRKMSAPTRTSRRLAEKRISLREFFTLNSRARTSSRSSPFEIKDNVFSHSIAQKKHWGWKRLVTVAFLTSKVRASNLLINMTLLKMPRCNTTIGVWCDVIRWDGSVAYVYIY